MSWARAWPSGVSLLERLRRRGVSISRLQRRRASAYQCLCRCRMRLRLGGNPRHVQRKREQRVGRVPDQRPLGWSMEPRVEHAEHAIGHPLPIEPAIRKVSSRTLIGPQRIHGAIERQRWASLGKRKFDAFSAKKGKGWSRSDINIISDPCRLQHPLRRPVGEACRLS